MAVKVHCPPLKCTAKAIYDAEQAHIDSGKASPNFKILCKQKRELPMNQHGEELLEKFQKSSCRVLLVMSGTGSGKTTQTPQFLYHALGSDSQKIVVTQPRRMATTTVAKRVAQELDAKLGAEVGYRVSGEAAYNKQSTRLVFVTDGLLLASMTSDPSLEEYSCVIIDEAHERSVEIDILLGQLKRAMGFNHKLKVVIMSATLNKDIFLDFFRANVEHMEVPGKMFDVDVRYLSDNSGKLGLDAAAQVIWDIHLYESEGDILVFLSGLDAIQLLDTLISHRVNLYEEKSRLAEVGRLQVVELYGSMTRLQEEDALRRVEIPEKGHDRKVILSTNVGETSITFEGVVFVIDLGTRKQKVWDPRTRATIFEETIISKASAAQRRGRAGRTKPGRCYRIYTKAQYDRYPEHDLPSIATQDLANGLLRALSFKRINELTISAFTFPFVQRPAEESVMSAYRDLHTLGFYDTKARHLSGDGMKAVSLSVEPRFAKILMESHKFGCTEQVLSIIVMLDATSATSLWLPAPGRGEAERRRHIQRKYSHGLGEHLQLLNVYEDWVEHRSEFNGNRIKEDEWCHGKFLKARLLRQADTRRDQILLRLQNQRIPVARLALDDKDYFTKVRRALCAGYFMQAAARTPLHYKDHEGKPKVIQDVYTTIGGVQARPESWFQPGNNNSSGINKDFIIWEEYSPNASPSSRFRTVTVVKPEWLIASCPEFFHPEGILPGPVKSAFVDAFQQLTGLDRSKVLGMRSLKQ